MNRRAFYINHLDEKEKLLTKFKEDMKVRKVNEDNHNYYGIVTKVDAKARKVYVSWGGTDSIQHDPEELIIDISNVIASASKRIANDMMFSRTSAGKKTIEDVKKKVNKDDLKSSKEKAKFLEENSLAISKAMRVLKDVEDSFEFIKILKSYDKELYDKAQSLLENIDVIKENFGKANIRKEVSLWTDIKKLINQSSLMDLNGK